MTKVLKVMAREILVPNIPATTTLVPIAQLEEEPDEVGGVEDPAGGVPEPGPESEPAAEAPEPDRRRVRDLREDRDRRGDPPAAAVTDSPSSRGPSRLPSPRPPSRLASRLPRGAPRERV